MRTNCWEHGRESARARRPPARPAAEHYCSGGVGGAREDCDRIDRVVVGVEPAPRTPKGSRRFSSPRGAVMEENVVRIFDTTLRDGEQAPGNAMTPEEKLRLARQLDALGVDVIEAGVPAASDGDFRGVRAVAGEGRRPAVAALARCHDRDIDLAGEALGAAPRPRLPPFIPTSRIPPQHKPRVDRPQGPERARP